VNPLDFPLLADENVHPEVVRFLVDRGDNVQSVAKLVAVRSKQTVRIRVRQL